MSRRPRDTSWPPDPEPLPHPLVDGHTHLETVLAATDGAGWRTADGAGGGPLEGEGAAGAPDPAGAAVRAHLDRAARAGVTRLVQVGCDLPAVAWTDAAVRAHPALLGAVAIHPNEAVRHAGVVEATPDGLDPHDEPHHAVPLDDAIARVAEVARANDRVRAVGETGLDFFRAGEQGRAVQCASFRAHVALAKELGLALQVHDRDAHEDVVAVLLADGAPERTVIHCFSGDVAMARLAAEQGWYLSFAGPVTYPSADGLRAALRAVPLDRVLLETDAPYLPPHPFRGRPNAPYLVAHTAAHVADVLGLPLAQVCETVWRTSEQVYGPW